MNLKKRNEIIGKFIKAAFDEIESNYDYEADKKAVIEYLEYKYTQVSDAIVGNGSNFIKGDIYSCIVSFFHLSAFALQTPQDVYILCNTILENKGGDYQDNGNSLQTFDDASRRYGVSSYLALGILLDKHVSTILKAFRRDNFAFKGESMKEKIADAINYFGILYAMIVKESEGSDA